jgi:hypothetical protein
MNDYVIRETEPFDYRELSRIIDDEWKFTIYSELNGLGMAECYLMECMEGANAALTLLVDGRPEGIAVLRDMQSDTIDVSARADEILAEIKEDPQFDHFQNDMRDLYAAYNDFAMQSKHKDWAELRLLIVSKRCKGQGLGCAIM